MSVSQLSRERVPHGRGEDPAAYAVRLYIQYLQGLFNFMPSGGFHWEPDNEVSEIVIRGEAPIDMKTVGKRPAITVVMGPYQYAGIGIDNMLSWNPLTEERKRTDLLSGHLVVYCLSNSDLQSSRLAHIVAHHTRVNQRLLESPGGFHHIARPAPTVNSPSPPGQLVMGDPQGLVMVQVNIPFQLQWTWVTTPRQSSHRRTLEMITKHRRASEYDYTSPQEVEHIQLAMSTRPVLVRRISGSGGEPPYATRPITVTVGEGTEDFQVSGLEPFQDG